MAFGATLGGGDIDVPGFNRREGLRAGLVRFLDALARALEEKLARFGDNSTTVAGDFQTVGSRGFAGRCDEMSDRAVGEFDDGGHFIFPFNGVICADSADGGDALRRKAGDPPDLVEVVRTLVDQDAATFAGPCRAPTAG